MADELRNGVRQSFVEKTAMKEFKVIAKGDVTEIYVYDAIGEDKFWGGGISPKSFADAVSSAKTKQIHLRVNSPGGSVFDAQAMLSALDRFKGDVTAFVDGHAASAASFLIMGAKKIVMSEGAFIMIHRATAGMFGNADELRRIADLLENAESTIYPIYQRHTDATVEELAAWCAAETWMNAEESVKRKFAHEITKGGKVKNYADVSKFNYQNVPELKVSIDPAIEEQKAARQKRIAALKLEAA
jgi:ATP-dependent Clp protease, protease subunit